CALGTGYELRPALRNLSLSCPSPPHSQLPAAATTAEEQIASTGFEPGHGHSSRHLERLQHLSRSSIDSPQIALVLFPRAVPQLRVDPADSRDEAVGLYGAQDLTRVRIDLVDLPLPILPDPEHAFSPGEPRDPATGRWNRSEHAAALRIDFLDLILRDLIEVLAVEGRSSIRGDIDRAQHLSARRIQRIQLVSGCKPDMLAVIRDPMHLVHARKGSILTDDLD